MKKALTIALAALAMASAPSKANAQLGSGVVYDPTNFKNAVLRYKQLKMQLAQLQQTYNQIVDQYNLAVQMAKHIPNMPSRYLATWAPWRYASAQDLYGNTTPWLNGANSGVIATVLNGYQKATNTLQAYTPPLLSAMPLDDRQRALANAATVELADGAAQNAMETVGAIRANAVTTTNAIGNIQSDSLSDDANLNTEVSVLNKVNATNVLALQNAQDTNKLLVAVLEEQTILAKHLRDAEASAANADIERRVNSFNFNQQLTAGVGSALNAYRLP
jgi:hypothetical protein